MPKELVISAAPHETRVAIIEDGQLCEIYIEREKEFALVGSIYKGRVTRVLPGMQSAFVEIGLDSDAFLYVGDFLENLEDYDHVVTAVEGKVDKMEQQGGTVFGEPPATEPAAGEPSAIGATAAEEVSPQLSAELSTPAEVEGPEPGNSLAEQPPRNDRPPAVPFERQAQGRGQGGYGRGPGPGQGGQGYDRGGGGRRRGGSGGGRWRRGGGGGRDPRQGRDLPPAKYASPRPYISRPYEPPTEPAEEFEPIILPGESLAKYKDRVPGSAPASAGTAAPGAEVSAEGLPPSLYAAAEGSSIAEPVETPETPGTMQPPQRKVAAIEERGVPAGERVSEPTRRAESFRPTDAEALSEYQALPEEPPRALESHEPSGALAQPGSGAGLSDEDVTSLAEHVAEARQEAVAAEAEADSGLGESEEEDEAIAGEASEMEEHLGSSEDHPDHVGHEDHEDMPTMAIESGEPGEPSSLDASTAHDQPPTRARMSDPQRARFQRPMRRGNRPRGNRPRQSDHRQQQAPRRPQLISEMLKAGQEIIVQIAKEPLGKKGARITSHVALPGRFLVYMPTVNHIGVSRRIASSEERSRLRRLVTESKGTFPGGFIVRTAAEGAPDDEIRADVEFLGRTWDKIRNQAEPRRAPALLHRDLNLVERILRDYVSNDYTAIWIDNEEEFSKVVDFVGRFQPKLVSRVKLYTKAAPIFEEFGIQQDLDRALRPKVWLKSGGYIVINHTEALVAIDVNTGKYVGRGSTRLEDTIVKTNLEAVKEIVRQIRLRDLGGIIVLDFIDMEERRNRDKVMAALDSALRADRAPSKALAFNEFGLVAVTRKRTKQSLERVLCQPCPYCTGSGMVKSVPTICYEIQAEARKMAADLEASTITLRVHPEIAKALKTREAALIEELEQATRKSTIIQADPTLHWEQYDIY